MDSRTEVYFATYFDMFDSPGWKQLVREANEQIEAFKEKALTAQSWEETLYFRGRIDQLETIPTMERDLEIAYESAKQDEVEAETANANS